MIGTHTHPGLCFLIAATFLPAACGLFKSDAEPAGQPPADSVEVTVKEQGWLKEFKRPGGDSVMQLHTKQKVYWLDVTRNARYSPDEDITPAEANKKPKINWVLGEDHEYAIKGYVSDPLTIEWFGTYPVLYAIEANRMK